MKDAGRGGKIPAKDIAFCGMAAALGVTVLFISGFLPVLSYAAPLAVSLILLYVKNRLGTKLSWMTYIVTSLLLLILGADKEAALFYLFFGYYPLIGGYFEKIKSKPLGTAAKFLFFLSVSAAMDLMFIKLLGISAAEGFTKKPGAAIWFEAVFCILLSFTMMIYDVLIRRLRYFKHVGR